MILDLGMPRNFSPCLSENKLVFLYDLDLLKKAAEKNNTAREHSAADANLIVEHAVVSFGQWYSGLKEEVSYISLQEKIRLICEEEVKQHGQGEAKDNLAEVLSHKLSQRLVYEISQLNSLLKI